MENEAELIREQMAETRSALSEKLEALQDHVVGTVEGTTRSVTETVSAVQEAVQDTVGTVKESVQETVESVKSAFDLSEQTQKRPWLMVGGAVAVGYVGGRLLMGHHHTGLPPASNGNAAPAPPSRSAVAASAVSSAATGAASWLEGLAGPLMKQVEGLALGVLAGVAADLIQSSAPETMRGQLHEMVENFASSAGTSPIRGLFAGDQSGAGSPGNGHSGSPSSSSRSTSTTGGFRPNSPVI